MLAAKKILNSVSRDRVLELSLQVYGCAGLLDPLNQLNLPTSHGAELLMVSGAPLTHVSGEEVKLVSITSK